MNPRPSIETSSRSEEEALRRLPLPGMAAIALWMLGLATLGVLGVLTGHFQGETSRVTVLVLSSLFALAGLGLIRRRRWGWALTLAAAFLCMCFASYFIFHWHQTQWIFMGLLNLVFFLYLARSDVTQRLR